MAAHLLSLRMSCYIDQMPQITCLTLFSLEEFQKLIPLDYLSDLASHCSKCLPLASSG